MSCKIYQIFFICLLSHSAYAQNLIDKLDKGKVVSIEVWPHGDAWTNPNDYHLLKFSKVGHEYFLEIKQDSIAKESTISYSEAIIILNHYEGEYKQKSPILNQGLSYDKVKIKAGRKRYKFKTVQYNDREILKAYTQLP